MRVLVTGGGGFIGSHVVKQLLAAGNDVRVLHLPKEDLRNIRGLDVERIPGDITDAACVRRAVQGCAHVYHLAAIYALWLPRMELMHEVNVGGTRNVLDACLRADTEKVVYTSSIAVFGGQGLDRDATEESPFALGVTGDLYSRSKFDAHQVAQEFVRRGLPLTTVAPCGPVGPGDVGPTPTGKLLITVAQMPIAIAPHTNTNLLDVRDCAAGHLLAAERGKIGESYLLGNVNLTTAELVRAARKAAGLSVTLGGRLVPVPNAISRVAASGLGAVARLRKRAPIVTSAAARISELGLRADATKAFTELGLPRRPIEHSLRDSLIWFAQNGTIRNAGLRARLLELTPSQAEGEQARSASSLSSAPNRGAQSRSEIHG